MIRGEKQVRVAIAGQAADWFVANDDGLSESEQAGLVSWLRDSPKHVQAFLEVSQITRDLAAVDAPNLSIESLVAAARAEDTADVVTLVPEAAQNSRTSRRRRTRMLWAAPLAAAAALLVVAVSFLWWNRDGERFGLPRTYETAHGEQGAWRLPDGSMLHLNTESSATVRYSGSERVVALNRGQALFDVSHGDRRRFRVSAAGAQVIATGTQFDVYRRDDLTLITVVQGDVKVYAWDSTAARSSALPASSIALNAGEQIGVDAGGHWGEPASVDTKAAVAWLRHEIVAQNRPLGEVAAEFNRYGRVQIVIDDPALKMLRISGHFDAYDTDSFAAFLASLEGVKVEKTSARIRVFKEAEHGTQDPDH
jgi:transmembrane sensor